MPPVDAQLQPRQGASVSLVPLQLPLLRIGQPFAGLLLFVGKTALLLVSRAPEGGPSPFRPHYGPGIYLARGYRASISRSSVSVSQAPLGAHPRLLAPPYRADGAASLVARRAVLGPPSLRRPAPRLVPFRKPRLGPDRTGSRGKEPPLTSRVHLRNATELDRGSHLHAHSDTLFPRSARRHGHNPRLYTSVLWPAYRGDIRRAVAARRLPTFATAPATAPRAIDPPTRRPEPVWLYQAAKSSCRASCEQGRRSLGSSSSVRPQWRHKKASESLASPSLGSPHSILLIHSTETHWMS